MSTSSGCVLDHERWRSVVGWSGLYEVSDRGRVRSVDRVIAIARHTRRYTGRILRQGTSKKNPHPRVILYRCGDHVTCLVHRLVLDAFCGPCPEGMQGCHEDDIPTHNYYPENLRWDTPSANRLDSVRNGLHHQARKTHCPTPGVTHLLQQPNISPSGLRKGSRDCLACSRARRPYKTARARGETVEFSTIADAKYAEIMGLVLQ